MADRSEIRDWVRQQTLIEADDFAADKLNAVINQGVAEVGNAWDWPFLEASEELIIEDGQAAYDFPTNFSRLIAITDEDGNVIPETTRRLALEDFAGADDRSPEAWYFFGEQFVFVPSPSETEYLTVDYLVHPTTLANDTDEPQWHSAFHMILAEYAAHKVWEREEDLERSGYHRQLFEIGLNQMKQHYRNRGQDSPIVLGGRAMRVAYPWSWQRD